MGNGRHIASKFSLLNILHYHFIERKLNSWLGYFLMIVIGLGLSYVTAVIDYKAGVAVVAGFASLSLLFLFFKFPYFGFYFTLAFSSLVVELWRLIDLPWGNVVDPMIVLAFLATIIRYDFRREIGKQFWSNPMTISLYILFGYSIIEAFNPSMGSMLGWTSYFRKEITYFIFYAIAYCLLNSKKQVLNFIYFTITLSTVLAIYACKQQIFGYAPFEMWSIMKGGPMAYQLLFQGGLLRKFSVFSDPATSGILFASTTMQCVLLLIRDSNNKRRVWWAIASILNILAYSFSGTRTATMMIIVGIAFYSLVTLYEKRTLVFMIFCTMFFWAMYVSPFQNVVTNRIRTTFNGTKDESAAIRDYDRHQIQPYLFDHPMGGGIFTTWAEGPKYNPTHPLAKFMPDSGYAKMLAEQGSIGLALLLLTYLIQMRQGLKNFYKARDPEVRNHYIAIITMVFTLMVAQYAQMAISQYPIMLYYYAFLAVLYKFISYENPVINQEKLQTT
jgi:hypothetical protein